MAKRIIRKKKIAENSFEAGVSGGLGSTNYQTSISTFDSPDVRQDPNHFASSDFNGSGSLAQPPERPDRQSSSGALISPGVASDKAKSETPLDPKNGYSKDVDDLFKKKVTPSPDEIMTGIQYELNKMVRKDKQIAKAEVIKNLKSDPTYYSRLGMLNIDPDKMKVDEKTKVSENSTTVQKTKAVLDEMIDEKRKNSPIQSSKEIDAIMKDLVSKRRGLR
jgi:hypothetical protein